MPVGRPQEGAGSSLPGSAPGSPRHPDPFPEPRGEGWPRARPPPRSWVSLASPHGSCHRELGQPRPPSRSWVSLASAHRGCHQDLGHPRPPPRSWVSLASPHDGGHGELGHSETPGHPPAALPQGRGSYLVGGGWQGLDAEQKAVRQAEVAVAVAAGVPAPPHQLVDLQACQPGHGRCGGDDGGHNPPGNPLALRTGGVSLAAPHGTGPPTPGAAPLTVSQSAGGMP